MVKYRGAELRHGLYTGLCLCDISSHGHDHSKILANFIKTYDPKMKRALTPERVGVLCGMNSVRETGKEPDITEYNDDHDTIRYRGRDGRLVSGETAIRILTEQLK
jgi:hypothetical protein